MNQEMNNTKREVEWDDTILRVKHPNANHQTFNKKELLIQSEPNQWIEFVDMSNKENIICLEWNEIDDHNDLWNWYKEEI